MVLLCAAVRCRTLLLYVTVGRDGGVVAVRCLSFVGGDVCCLLLRSFLLLVRRCLWCVV